MKGDPLNIHQQLILSSQAGDPLAQGRLYKLYAQAMYNICRRMMKDEEEAQDLLQESFIDAFNKLPTLREVHTFSSWIKRIVINNCLNALKRRRLVTTELDENWDAVEVEEDDFEYQKYRAEAIMKAVEQLPDGCKTVLNLYLFEGYDHKEIAQILAITESASKAQYCKAKSRIRKILEDKQQNYAG